METTVPEVPAKPAMTTEQAEAYSMMIQAIAEHFGPQVQQLHERWAQTRQRDQAATLQLEVMRRGDEARRALRTTIAQCALIVGLVGVCGYAAWLGQWTIVERIGIGLVGLGFVIGARGGR